MQYVLCFAKIANDCFFRVVIHKHLPPLTSFKILVLADWYIAYTVLKKLPLHFHSFWNGSAALFPGWKIKPLKKL